MKALYQWQDNKQVIGNGSMTLTPAERNDHLHSIKLEFLALCDKFYVYLYYAPTFIVYTDNNDLHFESGKIKCFGSQVGSGVSRLHFDMLSRYQEGLQQQMDEHTEAVSSEVCKVAKQPKTMMYLEWLHCISTVMMKTLCQRTEFKP